MSKQEDEFYILGSRAAKRRQNCNRYKIMAAVVLGLGIFLGLFLFIIKKSFKDEIYSQPAPLDAVKVLPEGSTPPLFNEKYPMKQFVLWVAKNLKYPDTDLIVEKKVVVSFIIDKKGHLNDIHILSDSKNKIYNDEVVRVLNNCPKWLPAKKADGTPVNIQYVLPITFKSTK